MRDAIVLPFSEEDQLVITTDNSGAIGMKEQDIVNVPYDVVSYYSFRVAVMECMATGARPISVVLQNFCGNEAWDELVSGIERGLAELNMANIPISGSTESNFSLSQSAIGLNVIGKKSTEHYCNREVLHDRQVALIGLPLVGEEVVSDTDSIAPLAIFKQVCGLDDVVVWPVGSKGVLHELKRMFSGSDRMIDPTSNNIDFHKSGGPSTSFLITYPTEKETTVTDIVGKHFNKL